MGGMSGQQAEQESSDSEKAASAGNPFGGMMPSGMGNPFEQTKDESQTEEPAQANEETEPSSGIPEFSGMPSGYRADGQNGGMQPLGLMAGSLIVLLAAILFAKFYKSNR